MALSHQEKKGGKEYTTFSLETVHLVTECQIKVKLLNRRPLDLVPLMCRRRAEQGASLAWQGEGASTYLLLLWERGWIWYSSDVSTSITFLTDDIDFNCTPG